MACYTISPLVKKLRGGKLTDDQFEDSVAVLETLSRNPSHVPYFEQADAVAVAVKIVQADQYRKFTDSLASLMVSLDRYCTFYPSNPFDSHTTSLSS